MTPKLYTWELNDEKLCKASKLYKNDARIIRHNPDLGLAGQILRRYAINREFGIPFENIRFGKDKSGKPYLVGYENIFFNVSHSGNICACAVHCKEVGLDIQLHTKGYNEALAKKYFTSNEIKTLEGANEHARKWLFHDFWAKHESLVKFYGLGLSALKYDLQSDRTFLFSHRFDSYSICLCY